LKPARAIRAERAFVTADVRDLLLGEERIAALTLRFHVEHGYRKDYAGEGCRFLPSPFGCEQFTTARKMRRNGTD
jgi:hypothetical protein